MIFFIKLVMWISVMITSCRTMDIEDIKQQFNRGDDPGSWQNQPAICTNPPTKVYPWQCCSVPMLFEYNHFKKCNLSLEDNVSSSYARNCLLEKNGLTHDKINIDLGGLTKYLRAWQARHNIPEVLVNALFNRCGKDLKLNSLLLSLADTLMMCFGFTVYKICPRKVISEECTQLKSFMDNCAHFAPVF